MWWQVLFWILLIPLVIAEIIIFVKTKRVSWLFYALAIFVYVVSVSYTLDVFDAGRNAVILTLIASAALMAAVGRHLSRETSRKKMNPKAITAMIVIFAVMLVAFVVSVIFGRAAEQVVPADSVAREDILVVSERDEPRRLGERGVTLLRRELSNSFFLPVPIVRKEYTACLETSQGLVELWPSEDVREQYPEVPPGGSETVEIEVSAYVVSPAQADMEIGSVLVQEREDYASCDDIVPDYRIPVT